MSSMADISVKPEEVRKSSWKDFAIRIAFGGAVTATAYLIGERFGPAVAGLFLAFPAIMPASVTLVAKHSGEGKAISASLGTLAGTLGLMAFGAVIWLLGQQITAWLVLTLAAATWAIVGLSGWLVLEWLLDGSSDPGTDDE